VPNSLDTLSSAWSPLRRQTFGRLWLASLATYLAVWMQSVAGAWLMTSLTLTPLLVALMQTAISLPMCLLSLPAGVLADLVDRRRLILSTQALLLIASCALAALTLLDAIGAVGLLGLTFLLGTGMALNGPAWQASMCEAIERHEIAQALTLIGIAYNIARAVGPALAGGIQAAGGPGLVFVINAAAYAWVVAVAWRWHPASSRSQLPPERLISAIRVGLNYAVHTGAVRAPLIRSAAFMLPASSLWALIPVVGQARLGTSAAGFGFLIGSLGVGAILGGLLLPWLRARVALETQIATATAGYALTLALTALLPNVWTLCPALIVGGAAWSVALTSLSAALLTSVPMWVRSRTIALSMLASQGFMAGGAALWGVIANHGGTDLALALASGLMVILLFWARRHPVEFGQESDVTLAPTEVQPAFSSPVPPEAGPVAVEIRYRIDPRQREAFLLASELVGKLRRRNGARIWRLYRDLADEALFVERFIVDSWVDYQRQLTRSTLADHAHEERVRAFLQPGAEIEVSHYLAER
jgi:MFS family permease/quinol monooxygenase YgiN